jgi:exopolyphosphatase/guanosine-5'-triphosphate,3'-diphosphate pyrophosphatase
LEKTAAIDIGTNTIRMLVGARRDGRMRPLARLRRITAMGRSLPENGSIGEAEFRDSIDALRHFRSEMDRLGVSRYRACATAGLRQASNADRFIAEAAEAGIEVEVISSDEEARLAWGGMLQGAGSGKGTLLMDIGGGSTEFAVGPGTGQSVSLPIGVVVTWEAFRPSDPPEGWQVAAMTHFFRARIADGAVSLPRKGLRRMAGTAGSFTTLAALDRRMKVYRPERIDGYVMSADAVRKWADRLCSLTDAQRLALPGMEKGRERYMIPGMLQAVAALDHFGIHELVISDSGLLEGILDSLARNAS